MWNYIYQDELYHYGVKGMKWGVKKSEYDSMSKDQKKRSFVKNTSKMKNGRKILLVLGIIIKLGWILIISSILNYQI